MGNKKGIKSLLLTFFMMLLTSFVLLVIISFGTMAYLSFHITPKGIVHNMGKICEECVVTAESNKTLMDKTYAKLIRYPRLLEKYGNNAKFFINKWDSSKIYYALDLDWDKLFSYSSNPDIEINYKEKYTYDKIKKNNITLDMIDSFIVRGGCHYTFTVDKINPSMYKLKVNWRDIVAEITPNGVKRDYFVKFPHFIEKWMK